MDDMLNVDYFKLAQLVFYRKFWFDDGKRKEMKIYFYQMIHFSIKKIES